MCLEIKKTAKNGPRILPFLRLRALLLLLLLLLLLYIYIYIYIYMYIVYKVCIVTSKGVFKAEMCLSRAQLLGLFFGHFGIF